jgi:hypothetical protein
MLCVWVEIIEIRNYHHLCFVHVFPSLLLGMSVVDEGWRFLSSRYHCIINHNNYKDYINTTSGGLNRCKDC